MAPSQDAEDSIAGVLDRLFAAWRVCDASAVSNLFAEKGIYYSSLGPEPGERAVGRVEIRDLIERMFKAAIGENSEILGMLLTDAGAFWTWRYSLPDGRVELGCDYLRVKDSYIVLKDAYRKLRP